jgi:hypothetical protein
VERAPRLIRGYSGAHCYVLTVDVVNPIFPFPHLFFTVLAPILYLGVIALLFLGLYLVVRAAVRRALQEHQLWLDSRGTGNPPPA